MKPIYFSIISILIFIASSVYSQTKNNNQSYAASNDSLLFDGAGELTNIVTNSAVDCNIKVTYTYGKATGTKVETKVYDVCGQKDTIISFIKGVLEKSDVLKIDEEITTGENSNLELELYDGSVIRVGPNSKLKIAGDFCDSRTYIQLYIGKIYSKIIKLVNGGKLEIHSETAVAGVRGTKFSVEVTTSETVVNVYEGSVEVTPKTNIEAPEKDAEDISKLSSDYQAGKVTLEEYVRKTQEFYGNLNKLSESVKSKMCEAGFMVNIIKKVSDPVPIESAGSEWFDDVNFKK